MPQGFLVRLTAGHPAANQSTQGTKTRNATQDRALAAFIRAKAEIDATIAELTEASKNHFGIQPEAVDWTDLEALQRLAHALKQASAEVL